MVLAMAGRAHKMLLEAVDKLTQIVARLAIFRKKAFLQLKSLFSLKSNCRGLLAHAVNYMYCCVHKIRICSIQLPVLWCMAEKEKPL